MLRQNRELRAALGGDYFITPDIVLARKPLTDQELFEAGESLDPAELRSSPLRRRGSSSGLPILHADRKLSLQAGKAEAVAAAIARLRAGGPESQKLIDNAAGYFRTNAGRMRYADFRRQGLFAGSGVAEAGCRVVVGERLKRSGMRWTVRGANSIIALRCCLLSGRREEFREMEAAA